MRYALIALIAILIACAFVLPAAPVNSLGKSIGLGSNSKQVKDHGSDHDNEIMENEKDTDDIEEIGANGTLLAGGGGWNSVKMSGSIFKDTFGVFIDGDSGNWSYSSLVFQARDQDSTLHALNFTNVVFDNTSVANMTYVHAWGWASFDDTQGFWFHLVLMDNGSRSNDLFDLALYKDTNKNWIMDETAPLLHWVFNGLEGGNIWIGAGNQDSEI